MQPGKARAVEWRQVDSLVPYEGNARRHSAEQIDKIARSIEAFGFNNPILVDAHGVIVAGHGRALAARQLGMERVPVLCLGHLTDAQRRAYTLADNRLAEDAAWDDDMLAAELARLQADGFALDVIGFDDDEIEALLAEAEGSDEAGGTGALEGEDEAPEPEAVAISQPGDLWLIGPHRVLCGDSTSAEAVAALLAGQAPNLMVTNPPYGVDYDPEWRNRAQASIDNMITGARAVGLVANDGRADWRDAWALFPGSVAYVWHSALHGGDVRSSLEAGAFEMRSQIVWVKQHFTISRGHYHWRHEVCWYAVRKGATANWQGDRKQQTVWEIKSQMGWESSRPNNPDKATGHSTQKPVECMRRPILNHTKPGELVFDPFLGSGTTLVAAHTEGRIGLGLELMPAYVDVICRRLAPIVGEPARLDGDGRTFEQIAEARGRQAAA